MKTKYAAEAKFETTTETICPNHNIMFAKFSNSLMSRKELSPGAKVTYSGLSQCAGPKHYAQVKQKTLAAKTGFSVRQVANHLEELEHFRLIRIKQVGLNCANIYYFFKHPWIEELDQPKQSQNSVNNPITPEPQEIATPEVTSEPQEVAVQELQKITSEPQEIAVQELQKIATPLKRSYKKTHIKEHTLKEEKSSVCGTPSVVGKYSYEKYFDYAKTQKNLYSAKGWAIKAHQTGKYDHIIEAEEAKLSEQQNQQTSKNKPASNAAVDKLIADVLALGGPLDDWAITLFKSRGYLVAEDNKENAI